MLVLGTKQDLLLVDKSLVIAVYARLGKRVLTRIAPQRVRHGRYRSAFAVGCGEVAHVSLRLAHFFEWISHERFLSYGHVDVDGGGRVVVRLAEGRRLRGAERLVLRLLNRALLDVVLLALKLLHLVSIRLFNEGLNRVQLARASSGDPHVAQTRLVARHGAPSEARRKVHLTRPRAVELNRLPGRRLWVGKPARVELNLLSKHV